MTKNSLGLLFATAAVATAVTAAACASAGGAHAGSCAAIASDSSFARSEPVYRDCAVDKKAQLTTTSLHPDFRPMSAHTGCYSAEVEFVVDTLGRPETGTARITKSNDPAFADAVLALVPQLRYSRALKNGTPVRQIVVDKQTALLSTVVVVAPMGATPTAPSSATSRGRAPAMPSC
jgi:hypothetical protein